MCVLRGGGGNGGGVAEGVKLLRLANALHTINISFQNSFCESYTRRQVS